MSHAKKSYNKICPVYSEPSNITIDFLVGETFENPSPDDYAPNEILSCDCRNKYHCTRPRHECPIWQNIRW